MTRCTAPTYYGHRCTCGATVGDRCRAHARTRIPAPPLAPERVVFPWRVRLGSTAEVCAEEIATWEWAVTVLAIDESLRAIAGQAA